MQLYPHGPSEHDLRPASYERLRAMLRPDRVQQRPDLVGQADRQRCQSRTRRLALSGHRARPPGRRRRRDPIDQSPTCRRSAPIEDARNVHRPRPDATSLPASNRTPPGRSGAFRSIDNGTYALRKSPAARLDRRKYSATWFPCCDRIPSSSSRSDRRTLQMRQASDHSSRNRRQADSSQPSGSWKPAGRFGSRGRTLAVHRPTTAYRGTRPCPRAQAEGRVWRGSCRRRSTRFR